MPQSRKSQNLHKLQNTVSQALPDKPSLYRAGRPKIPAHLSRVARAEFKRCVKLLEERGTVTPGDMATLAIYAEVQSRWVAAKTQIGDSLMVTTTVKDTNGEPVEVSRLNPLLRVAQDCEKQLRALAKTLGLTPIDRDKVKPAIGAGINEPDPAEIPGTIAFMAKHGRTE